MKGANISSNQKFRVYSVNVYHEKTFTKYIRNFHLCQINSHQKFQANEGLAGARAKCYNAAHKVLSSEPKLQLYLVHILSLKGLLTCQRAF